MRKTGREIGKLTLRQGGRKTRKKRMRKTRRKTRRKTDRRRQRGRQVPESSEKIRLSKTLHHFKRKYEGGKNTLIQCPLLPYKNKRRRGQCEVRWGKCRTRRTRRRNDCKYF